MTLECSHLQQTLCCEEYPFTVLADGEDPFVAPVPSESDPIPYDLLPATQPVWPLEYLAAIPFDIMKHAKGSAGDLPEIVVALASAEQRAEVEEVACVLFGLLCHRGFVYNACAYVVPFLAMIAVECDSLETKLEVLRLLVNLGSSTDDSRNGRVIKNKICQASFPILRALKFCPYEPSVKNVSACFYALVLPPVDEGERRAVAAQFLPILKTHHFHPKFQQLGRTARSVLLGETIDMPIDLEQLETDLFDAAEEFDSQAPDRMRLLAVCSYIHFRQLPVDLCRRVRGFLFEPAIV